MIHHALRVYTTHPLVSIGDSALAARIAETEHKMNRASGEGFTYELGRLHAFMYAREIVIQEARAAVPADEHRGAA